MNFQEWQMKRVTTTRAFHLQCVMLGMEYSVTFLSLWLYLNTLVETEHKEFFYSIISASYLLAAVLFSVLIGRWVDKTHNVRQTFLICNTLVIIGNFLYVLHYSPWLLVLGRLICGMGSPLRSVISGEIARCYPADEVLRRFSANGMAFALGFIMGPGVNFIFKDINFTIAGSLHITYANIPGIYMSVMFIGTQIYVFFFLHDLSKEYDLKAEEAMERNGRQQTPEIRETRGNATPSNLTLEVPRKNSVRSTGDPFTQSEKCILLAKNRSSTFSYHTNQPSYQLSVVNVDLNNSGNSSTLSTHSVFAKQDEQNKSTGGDSGSGSTIQSSFNLRKQSLAIAKLERSGLFTQTFTRSDSMVSTSVLILVQSFNYNEETTPLLEDTDCTMYGQPMLSVWNIIGQLVSHVDTLLVLVLTYFMWFWMVSFDMWLPIMVVDVLGMGITELNGIVFGFGCISAIVLSLLSIKGFSDKSLFKLSLFCMVSLALMELIFASMKLLHRNLYASVALWVFWGVLFAIVVVMDEVFLIGVLAKMTSSKVQTFNESLRLAMARLGALSALLTSVYLFKWLEYVSLVAVCFAVLVFFILLVRRKTLSHPKVIIM